MSMKLVTHNSVEAPTEEQQEDLFKTTVQVRNKDSNSVTDGGRKWIPAV